MARPLRDRILVVGAACGVFVLGALFLGSRMTYREQLRQLEDETAAMTAVVAGYLETSLAVSDGVASTFASLPAINLLQPGPAAQALRPLVGNGSMLRNAFVADPAGRVVAWAQPPTPAVEGHVSPAWLTGVAAAGGRTMSAVIGGTDDGTHGVVLGYPLAVAEGRTGGTLGFVVRLASLEAVLSDVSLPAGSIIALTDASGTVVARSAGSTLRVGQPLDAGVSLMAATSLPATLVRTSGDEVERVFGEATVGGGPWRVRLGIPTSVAADRTAPIYRRNLAIVFGALVLVLGLSLYMSGRWLSAVHDVGRTAERVAAGDLSPLESKDLGSVELNQLHGSIARMINSLRDAQMAVDEQMAEERRIREEKESLQRQLIRQERLAAIGVLVSGVAHELNNPLQAILGFAELLQLQEDVPESVRHDLGLIRRESTRASAIIRNLQRFGRQNSEPSPVRLSEVLASVLELRQRKIEAQEIRLDIEDQSDAVVSAVFTELQQVVLNFVINAEQAVQALDPSRRRIKIRTSDARNSARVEVEDHGEGVPAADEPKLFQPFFTTKPVGEGTGLGLSVSYGIISSHGGEIGYHRAPHGGAVFYFELPTR